MSMQYVKVFYDWKEQTAELTDEEFGSLMRALICYANGEDTGVLTGAVRILFPMFRRFVDFETEAYEKKVKQCREAARKGGLTTQANAKRRQANASETLATSSESSEEKEEVKEQVQAKDEEEEEVNDLFIQEQENENGVTDDFDMNDDLERINKFIIEKGLNCDAREFYDYYSERNWEIGGKRSTIGRASLFRGIKVIG